MALAAWPPVAVTSTSPPSSRVYLVSGQGNGDTQLTYTLLRLNRTKTSCQCISVPEHGVSPRAVHLTALPHHQLQLRVGSDVDPRHWKSVIKVGIGRFRLAET